MDDLWVPRDLRVAPRLAPEVRPPAPNARFALLINPFYPKDAHASFGKHVLTPSLALTSVAASTPSGWRVAYWDENILQGPPPWDPFPAVVGITVHLLIRHSLVAVAWRPLVELTRRRHLRFRRRLAARALAEEPLRAPSVVSAGV